VELIGLIPAAGTAARLAPLPCSKELLPVRGADSGAPPAPVIRGLLDRMRAAGVSRAYIVIRDGKWDLPRYLGDGQAMSLPLSYLMMGDPSGPPFTLDQAYPFVRDATVVFGFPDIIVEPADVYTPLIERLEHSPADVMLGLFPAHAPQEMDMVEADEHGIVRSLWLKPPRTELRDAWICAVWRPAFTEFLHEQIRFLRLSRPAGHARPPELSVGHLLQAALQAGLRLESVRFPEGRYVDIGTPDGWRRALLDGIADDTPAASRHSECDR